MFETVIETKLLVLSYHKLTISVNESNILLLKILFVLMFSFKMDRQRFVRLLQKRIPILGWMPFYDKEKFIADLIAGVTVGLTVMPQSLAYATLAGLQPQVIYE